ncbi:hypothetical protein DIS18_11825 [Algibacter marinivivus]|uniref:Cytochrome C and Quinol oxidase polypeptide I n=1 Tax=Algibacter marinivivus TaxID=2100723 RepID=A0A2U2X2E8_9FLAO|nr:hypothetical protein DIS18_11825 [Algibacter marinivivus]
MHQLQTKTYLYFWAAAVLTVLVSYTLFTKIHNLNLVLNIHKDYFVISNIEFNILIAYALAFIGLIYYIHYVFRILLFKHLTTIHTLITISCVILYFLSPMFLFGKNKDFPLFEYENSIDHFLFIIGCSALLAQPILFFNSIISSIKCFAKKTKL